MTQQLDLDQLVADYHHWKTQKEAIDERLKQITAQLRTLGPGKHQTTTATITVSAPTNRFNPDRAHEVLPTDLYQACTETVVSAKKAKEILPPALYTLCGTPVGEPRVTIKDTTEKA